MEVVREKAEVLSDYEVLALLGEVLANDSGGGGTGAGGDPSSTSSATMRHRNQQNLATIAYETTKYLKGTPCVNQNDEIAKRFMAAVDKFNLTKTERLQLLNLRPTTPVEINLIVGECEERLTEDQVGELLQQITSILPGDDKVDEAVERGGDDDNDATMEDASAGGTAD